jgi:excisionase family DNA binding protein
VATADPPVFTVTDLVKRWRTSRQTVTAAIRSGRLRAFKVNEKTYRITAEELARYEAAQQTQVKP